jgi:hypothetical protein
MYPTDGVPRILLFYADLNKWMTIIREHITGRHNGEKPSCLSFVEGLS